MSLRLLKAVLKRKKGMHYWVVACPYCNKNHWLTAGTYCEDPTSKKYYPYRKLPCGSRVEIFDPPF